MIFILEFLKGPQKDELTHCKGREHAAPGLIQCWRKLPDFHEAPGAGMSEGLAVLRKASNGRSLDPPGSINVISRSLYGQYRPWITVC